MTVMQTKNVLTPSSSVLSFVLSFVSPGSLALKLTGAGLALLVAACTTPQTEQPPAPRPSRPVVDQDTGEPAIDILGLERSLGLDSGREDLGFREKSFDTCSVGYGYSASHNCKKQSFVSIRFQLQCRESEGSISNADYEVKAIASDHVKWNLGKTGSGLTSTDGDGYGEIRTIASGAQGQQKLRLTVNGKFLILTAAEIRRIVTPGDWCKF